MARRAINPPLGIYKKIAFSFIILTLVLIGVIFYFTLSYAFITVYPSQETVSTDFNFIIVEDENSVDLEEGIFAGNVVDQILEGEKTFQTKGTKILAGDTVGTVTLFNDLTRTQALVATTRLLTPDGILFRLKNQVSIPGGGTIEAEVYADDSSKPLAKKGTKFTIPGLSQSLQALVYAEAKNDFKAGGQEILAVSQEDLDNAVEAYAEELAKQIVKDEESGNAKVLLKEVITKEFSNEIGDEVDEFTVKLQVGVIGAIFTDNEVKLFAEEMLEGLIPADKKLVATNSDNIVYTISNYDLDNDLVQIKSSISGIAIISENSPILDQEKLIKLNISEMESYLDNFESIENVEVGFFPAWIRKIPYFQDHIIIKIVE